MFEHNKMDNQTKNKPKESIAFYFSTELLEKLEEFHFHIQRQIPREKRKQLSKSKICELSLECLIDDYERNKCNSVFWQNITKWLAK